LAQVAGGSGLTPMLQVAYEVLKDPDDKTDVTLIFANVSDNDIILKDTLDELEAKHSNFHVHYVVSRNVRSALVSSASHHLAASLASNSS
jgi:cytochrome-b5 reductase